MTTPVVLVTGIEPTSMATTTTGLQLDSLHAVTVHHTIDVERQVLTRVVGDVTGVVERTHVDLDHACVSCALREDVLPTLVRLAGSGRWSSVIAHLPVAAEATQVCRLVDVDADLAAVLHVAAVVAVIDGPNARADLVGDDLLGERGLHTSAEDVRGVAETHAALIEYADTVAVVGAVSATDLDLVRALVRPDVRVVDHTALDGVDLAAGRREHATAEAWVHPVDHGVTGARHGDVWTIELASDRPFHPDRLLENIERLGGGARRSRGCFWLPTRPDRVCQWEGAGGQLSVGPCDHLGTGTPHTRIVVTGVDDDHDELRRVFEHCLLDDEELATRGPFWEAHADGLEPWLGPIRPLAA